MKRVIILLILGAALGGGGVWLATHASGKPDPDEKAAAGKPADEKPAGDEAADETHVTHDTNGNAVVNMSDDTRGDAGIEVSNPEAAKFSPERKGYGSVQDPAPLAALVQDWQNAKIALDFSSKEMERTKTLFDQKNASQRAFQTAQEAYLHDQAALDAIALKARTAWGTNFSTRIAAYVAADEAGRQQDTLVSGIIQMKSQLIRVDLPAGEALKTGEEIGGARIVPMATNAVPVEATFVDRAPGVDPQTQMQSLYFLASGDNSGLLPGAAVTAYIKLGGEPVEGVIVPRAAVVRTQGKAWVYVMDAGGEAFTRTAISLEHPAEGGWFVSNGIKPEDHLVTTGAQTLLSEEQKASLSGD